MGAIQTCFKRYEKKYLLTHEQYEQMRRGMAEYVRPDEHPRYTICNVYYDTDDYALIRASLEKPVYKEKLRVRSYGVPGEHDRVFVELKKKFNGVVYKRRTTMEAAEAVRYLRGVSDARDCQIRREIDFFLKSYLPRPKVFIAYDREAYAGREDGELRITFDTNLRARDTDVDLRLGEPLLPDGLILMEIKIPGTAPLWLARLLSGIGVFPTSFSKYGAYYKEFVLGRSSGRPDMKEVLSCA